MPAHTKTCATCGRTYASDADFLRGTSRFRQCSLGKIWFCCSCGSTLVLPPEKAALFRPDKDLSPDGANLFRALAFRDVFPRLPTSAARFEEKLSNPASSAAELSGALEGDPAFAARLLGAASQLMRDRGEPVRSLEHAIAILGREDLRRLALVSAWGSCETKTRRFSARRFWAESLLCGRLARDLARAVLPPDWGGLAALCGSLCNVGLLARAVVDPEEADLLEFQTRTRGVPTTRAEADAGMPPHETFGEVAAALWGLPDLVSQACQLHHSPEALTVTTLTRRYVAADIRDPATGALSEVFTSRPGELLLACVVLADVRKKVMLGQGSRIGVDHTMAPWAPKLFGAAFYSAWMETTEQEAETYVASARKAAEAA